MITNDPELTPEQYQQLETLNRAIGYCQALWYYKMFDTLAECQVRALEMYAIDQDDEINVFYRMVKRLVPNK